MRQCPGGRVQRPGFAYIALLVVLAATAYAALRVTETAQLAAQREAEQQLLFVGRQYRQAIESYTARDAGALRGPPARLEDLLADPRMPTLHRDLRRLYPDPFTGRVDWLLLRDARNRIVGVRSQSERQPLRRQGFAGVEAEFARATRYRDWVFAPARPAATPPASTSPVLTPPSAVATPEAAGAGDAFP